jgi:hypothetical protein
MLPHITINTDLVIFAIVLLCLLCGLFFGASRIKTFALSVYVGIVLATTFAQAVFDLATTNHMTFGLTIGSFRLILFAAPVILLELGHRDHGSKRHGHGMLTTLLLGIATAGLIISSGLSFLDGDTLKNILLGSNLASMIYSVHLAWLVSVPLLVVGASFIKMGEGMRGGHH